MLFISQNRSRTKGRLTGQGSVRINPNRSVFSFSHPILLRGIDNSKLVMYTFIITKQKTLEVYSLPLSLLKALS